MPKKPKIDYKLLEAEFFQSRFENAYRFFRVEKGFTEKYLQTGFHRLKTKGWSDKKKTLAKKSLLTSFVDFDESKSLTNAGENTLKVLSKEQISQLATVTESELLEFIFNTIRSLPMAYSSGLLSPKDFLAGQPAITNYLMLINTLKRVDSSGEELTDMLNKVSQKAKVSSEKVKAREVESGQVVKNGADKTDGISGEGGLKDHNQKKSMFVVVESDVKKESDK
jgi:hypothetical protein